MGVIHESDFVANIPYGFLTVFGTYLFGRRWKNSRAGFLSAGILASCALFFVHLRSASPGPAISFWHLVSLYGCLGIWTERIPERLARFSFLYAAGAVGSFFAGGLLAMLLTIAVLGLTAAYARLGSQLKKIAWIRTALFAVALVGGWLAIRHFVADGNRALWGPLAPPPGGFPFPAALLAGFLPWTVYLPSVYAAAFRHHAAAARDPAKAMLVIWSLAVAIFFTLAQGTEAHYAMTVLPAFALLCGDIFDEVLEVDLAPDWVGRGLLWLVSLAGLAVFALKWPQRLVEIPAFLRQAIHPHESLLALALGVGTLIFVGAWGMRRARSSLAAITLVQALLLGTFWSIAEGNRSMDELSAGEAASEFNLPQLVLPPETPAGLQLPEVVVKKDQWKGVQCAVQEPRVAVFRHADKWKSFWNQALAPFSPRLAKVPEVDFDKDMVLGVFLGQKAEPHFEIEIRKVRVEKRSGIDVLVVRYKEVKKMQGIFHPPFLIQPFHLKKVPAFAGEVLFEKI